MLQAKRSLSVSSAFVLWRSGPYPSLAWPPLSAQVSPPQTAVKRFLVSEIAGEHRVKQLARDPPRRLLACMGVAVRNEHAVQELEEVARNAECTERFDQSLLVQRRIEQVLQGGGLTIHRTGLETRIGDVIESFARPGEREHQVLLIEPCRS